MASFSHWCTLCSMCLLFTTNLCFDGTIEIGRNTVISCALSKEQNIIWQLRGETDFITVTSCSFKRNICVDYMPDRYHGQVRKDGDGFKTNLFISSARINETEFKCSIIHDLETIALEVYALPSNPVCDSVEVSYTNGNLVFKCRASNVFPSINGMLYIRGFSQDDVFNGHCSNEGADSLNQGAYVAECVWYISAAKLDPLEYSYYVKMNPNLTNMTKTNVPYVISQNYTLKLSIPTAVINYTQCPVGPGVRDGKLTNSSAATCRCVLESRGFPPAQARWYTLNGHESLGLDDIADGSSILVISSQNTGQRYQCRAWSPLRNAFFRGPVYTIIFAKPSSDPVPIILGINHVALIISPFGIAGIVAGAIVLTVIIAVVIWKLTNH